jgi:hypothetical protein
MNRLQVLDKTITPFTEARLSADVDAKAELFCPRKQYASKKRQDYTAPPLQYSIIPQS